MSPRPRGRGLAMLALAGLGVVAAALPAAPATVLAAPQAAQALTRDTLIPQPSTQRLLTGVEDMIAGRAPTPAYLGGSHPDWKGNTDHCYSIYFRVALRQGLLNEAQAEDLMARMHSPQPGAFLANLFPQGYQEVPFRVTAEGIKVDYGAIPAGHLISMDGSDHVMMSTGRLTPDGRHEVYSFKGGGAETPVWGDSVGYDPAARVHRLTLEDELTALRNDDQPLDHVRIVEGRSALEP